LYQPLVINEQAAKGDFVSLENVYGLENYRMQYRAVSMKGEAASDILLLVGPVFEVEPDVLTNETGIDEEITNKVTDLFDCFTSGVLDSRH